MSEQQLSTRDSLYGHVGAFFDDQVPKIISGTADRMSTREIPLYFSLPLTPAKVYSIAFDTDNLSDLPTGTFFAEQGMSILAKAVTLEERRPQEVKDNLAREIVLSFQRAGVNYVRPYDVEHPLTSWAIEHDASRGLSACYRLILSPEAPPTLISNDCVVLPKVGRTPQVQTYDPWDTVTMLRGEDYVPYEINDDEASLVLRTLRFMAGTRQTKHLYNESLAEYYCVQMTDRGIATMGMFMRPNE